MKEIGHQSVDIRLGRGNEFTEAEVEEMLGIRAARKKPKPGFDAVAEASKFRGSVRQSQYVGLARDRESGRAVGFGVTDLIGIDGNRAVVEPKYAYVLPGLRDRVGFTLVVGIAWWMVTDHDADLMVSLSSVSLQGFVTLSQGSSEAWILNETAVPEWADSLMREFGRGLGSAWDPNTGLVEEPTSRIADISGTLADPARAPYAQRYLSINPNWMDGYQAIAMFETTRDSIKAGLDFVFPELFEVMPAGRPSL